MNSILVKRNHGREGGNATGGCMREKKVPRLQFKMLHLAAAMREPTGENDSDMLQVAHTRHLSFCSKYIIESLLFSRR